MQRRTLIYLTDQPTRSVKQSTDRSIQTVRLIIRLIVVVIVW